MNHTTWLLLVMTACSPSPTTPDAATDGASDQTSPEAGDDSSTTGDAIADVSADAPFDAGACALSPVDGGACNALTASGSAVVPACHDTPAPTPVGGPIYNGRYVLTSIDYYEYALACPTETQQIDWSVCGTEWETIQITSGNQTQHLNATATPNGSALSLALTCPNTGNVAWQYDATSTSLVLYLPTTTADGGPSLRADTYTKM